MIIETILVILGILTTALGIWNIVIGAYVWGTLFLVGGIWAIGLGTLYIIQLRKERKLTGPKNTKTVTDIDSDFSADEGIKADELFEEAPQVVIAGTTAEPETEVQPKKTSKLSTFLSKSKTKKSKAKNEEEIDAVSIVELDSELRDESEEAKPEEILETENKASNVIITPLYEETAVIEVQPNYLCVLEEKETALVVQEPERHDLLVIEKEEDESDKEK